MSLTSTSRSPRAPRAPPGDPPNTSAVVKLNVGGEFFTTTVSTLRKIPGSRLAAMFCTLAKASTDEDEEGRFFIDRPGTYFGPILDYLRSGQMPKQHIAEVYREAQFFEITPLVKLLEDTPQIFADNLKWKNPEYLLELFIMKQFNILYQVPEKEFIPFDQ